MLTEPPILGRRAELERIDGRLAEVLGGRAVVVIVQGPPGSGVSCVLRAATARALAHGAVARVATATPGDRLVPLGQLVAAVGPVAARASAPTARALQREDRRYGLLRGVEDGLRDLADATPVVVALDDLQWADGGTTSSFGHIVRELADRPILWALGARELDLPPDLVDALDALEADGAERLRLGPLDDAAALLLAGDVVGGPPGPRLARLVHGCAGNPSLLVALLEGLVDESLVRQAGDGVELHEDALPLRVGAYARALLGRLSAQTREVARAAAALGTTWSFTQLAAMTQMAPAALLGPLDELTRCGAIVTGGERLRFREDLLRDAVLQTLSAPVRRAVRRQAAEVLLAEDGPVDEVARCLITAADDERPADGLLIAARRLAPLDPGAAAEVTAHAFGLVDADDPVGLTLAVETAAFLHAAGRREQADRFLRQGLMRATSPEQHATSLLRVAGSDDVPADVRATVARRALGDSGLAPDLARRLLANLLIGVVSGGDLAEAADVGAAVRAHDGGAGADDDVALRDYALALLDHAGGAYHLAAARLELAHDRLTGEDGLVDAVERAQAEALAMTTPPSTVVARALRKASHARQRRRAPAVRRWDSLHGRALLGAGRIADAAEVLRGYLEADGPCDSTDLAALAALARAAAHLGLADELAACVARAAEALENPAADVRRHARLLLAGAGGAFDARLEVPVHAADLGDPARIVRLTRARDPVCARTAAKVAADRRTRTPACPHAAAAALHARALLLADGDALGRATVALAEAGRPVHAAAACEDRAQVLADAGAEGARQALQEAVTRWAQVGAIADADRLRARAAEPGCVQGAWQRLTPAEGGVAELVAAGMSNRAVAERLGLSPHTVSDHLRHVYVKLDVHSRLRLIEHRHGSSW